MGRIKVFLRSFCLTGGNDQSHNEPPFDRSIDVSHLAEPHITSGPSQIYDQATPLTEDCENNNDENHLNHSSQQRTTPNSCAISVQQLPSNQRNLLPASNNVNGSSFARPSSSLHLDNGPSQPLSSPYAPSPSNVYEAQNNHRDVETPESRQNQPQSSNQSPPAVIPRDAAQPGPSSGGPTTKLSYDIISVREPLAKILAERQQLLQTQQQQRQLLGEHDYIEVYGERGSSCFYEEIAGSVTSSATYDQIGTNSNHNYQVLVNAYAVANRQSALNLEGEGTRQVNSAISGMNGINIGQQENAYDVTSHPHDNVDGPSTSTSHTDAASNIPNTSSATPRTQSSEQENQLTQSIPVYSVINKATRKSNSIMRTSLEDSRPPKPPPKNLLIAQHQQHSSSGMNSIDDKSAPPSLTRAWSPSHQLPSTSSFPERVLNHNESSSEDSSKISNSHRNARLPQPPPRLSKNSAFNHATDRPLPSPSSNFDTIHNNNNVMMPDRNSGLEDDDNESINNGYELLKSNIEEDQIDVGYEKIKESNRYSGGSISSQLYQRHFIDNGGYESVQPIYSSPSNALVEPNYEAIAPATASELAAAATAKLNAAASVIEQFLRKDK